MVATFFSNFYYKVCDTLPTDERIRLRMLVNALLDVGMFYDTQVDAGGLIKFPDKRGIYGSIIRYRTMSFTKFVMWLSRKDGNAALAIGSWQVIQDALVNWAAAENSPDRWQFELVSGEEVKSAYRDGPHTCMRGRDSQLALYVENPDKVQVLKISDKGEYRGRALLWTTDTGKKVLDRIYPGSGTLASATIAYAESQGWLVRGHNSISRGGEYSEDVAVTLKHPSNKRIAYLDSFTYLLNLSPDSLTLTTINTLRNQPTGRVYLLGIGSYTGTSSVYERGVKYLDGSPVVKTYVLSGGGMRLVSSASSVKYKHTPNGVVRRIVLRDGDTVVRFVGEAYYRPTTAVRVATDGKTYLKSQTRKLRGQDAYRAVEGAVAYTVTEKNHSSGAKILILEVEHAST